MLILMLRALSAFPKPPQDHVRTQSRTCFNYLFLGSKMSRCGVLLNVWPEWAFNVANIKTLVLPYSDGLVRLQDMLRQYFCSIQPVTYEAVFERTTERLLASALATAPSLLPPLRPKCLKIFVLQMYLASEYDFREDHSADHWTVSTI